MGRWTGAAILALAGAGAEAQEGCPVAADLARGVGVAYADGTQVVVRATERPAVLAMESRVPDGGVSRSELAQGTLALWVETATAEGASTGRTVFDHGAAPEALPAPAPGGQSLVEARVSAPWGESAVVEARRYGEAGQVTVAGCSYDGFEVIALQDDGVVYTFGGWFLPELGFGVGAWWEPPGEARQENEVVRLWAVE